MNLTNKLSELKSQFDLLVKNEEARISDLLNELYLDWNYGSGFLEKNSLNRKEIKALLSDFVTAPEKNILDHHEIIAHNNALNFLNKRLEESVDLDLEFISALYLSMSNHIDLIKNLVFEKELQNNKDNPSGYRVLDSLNQKGYFAEYINIAKASDIEKLMTDLISWYKSQINQNEQILSPIKLAADFYYKFLEISPFPEMNEKIGIILLNFILIQSTFPPIIISPISCQEYKTIFCDQDVENRKKLLFHFLTKRLMVSLQFIISGKIEIEKEEEEENLEARNFELHQSNPPKKNRILSVAARIAQSKKEELFKSKKILLLIYETSIAKIFKDFTLACQEFDNFYKNNSYGLIVEGIIRDQTFSNKAIGELILTAKDSINADVTAVKLKYVHEIESKTGLKNRQIISKLNFIFNEDNYLVELIFKVDRFGYTKSLITKKYGELADEKESSNLISVLNGRHQNIIKKRVGRKN